MHRLARTVLGATLLISGLCHAQSLADAARQSRKDKASTGPAKVITGDDLSAPSDVTIHLTPGSTSAGQGTIVAPGRGKHSYAVTTLDATSFTNGGTLHIRINVGDRASTASFDLFPQGAPLPSEGMPHPLASAHNIASGADAKTIISTAEPSSSSPPRAVGIQNPATPTITASPST